jgi:hypothetical protein
VPTAALLLSAVLAAAPGRPPRGNTVLDPSFERFSFSAAAAARFGVLLGGGTAFVQPLGFGFGAQIFAHLLPLGSAPARLGLAFEGGHTRFLERRSYDRETGGSVTRTTVLAHTDLTLGPSLQVVAGPLVILAHGGAGAGIGQLVRPVHAEPAADQQAIAAAFMLRGSLGLGIPIKNDHGLSVGVGFHKLFSGVRRPPDPAAAAGGAGSVVFDMLLSAHLAYQAWF